MIRLLSKLILSTFIFVIFSSKAFAFISNETCDLNELNGKPYARAYGPYDYSNPQHFKEKLPIVEVAHFDSNVERLISGMTGSLAGDIGYTLHAFPNHHRALNSMAKLQRQFTSEHEFSIKHKRYTATCYFKRAIHFQPKDAISRMIFAMHLHLSDKFLLAEQQYMNALQIQPVNPEIHYNLGLLYVGNKELQKAKKHAKIAYDAGYPLLGLANKIKESTIKN